MTYLEKTHIILHSSKQVLGNGSFVSNMAIIWLASCRQLFTSFYPTCNTAPSFTLVANKEKCSIRYIMKCKWVGASHFIIKISCCIYKYQDLPNLGKCQIYQTIEIAGFRRLSGSKIIMRHNKQRQNYQLFWHFSFKSPFFWRSIISFAFRIFLQLHVSPSASSLDSFFDKATTSPSNNRALFKRHF